jgi:hypothetical protein
VNRARQRRRKIGPNPLLPAGPAPISSVVCSNEQKAAFGLTGRDVVERSYFQNIG